ncbi:DEAD-box ATP-dependent RNA helicase 52B-like [Piliocolobus tephrosceles]|uniref:DEAD-box ATP-dependent RNA helicase 52B-like n=1 Tax=Piliocolobus tephrosceles TaxID=591936 RepID=UPI001300DEA5|nr:DEAD-box ATP-dependent RNA helicase 52B-like [Piliocolobus tephrosceles]
MGKENGLTKNLKPDRQVVRPQPRRSGGCAGARAGPSRAGRARGPGHCALRRPLSSASAAARSSQRCRLGVVEARQRGRGGGGGCGGGGGRGGGGGGGGGGSGARPGGARRWPAPSPFRRRQGALRRPRQQ